MSWLQKLREGLKKTSSKIELALRVSKLDGDALDAIEESFILADMGVETSTRLTQKMATQKPQSREEALDILRKELFHLMTGTEQMLSISSHKPFIILMLGVNGAGKTTTIGKMAEKFKASGYKVSFGAVDTFRMAAIEQLKEWGQKTNCPVYAGKMGDDPAGVAYDAVQKAMQNKDDVLFLDTAGRLQNKKELLDEIQKIVRVIRKIDPTAPHATLLTLDATVGQNAFSQVENFKQCTDLSGLIMTKLDGTAKGGILVALTEKFHLPIYYIGVGEKAEDLQPFTAKEYIDSLLGTEQ